MPKILTNFIEVVESRRNKLYHVNNQASFYLERDNWNDFGYYTSYSLHLSGKHTNDRTPSLIGHLRILKDDQQERENNLIPLGSLTKLSDDFCSMSNSLDYYERIAQIETTLRDRILSALRDCIIDPEIRDQFKRQKGFKTSLMRDMTIEDDIFELAPLMISRDFHKLLDLDLSFEFTIPELDEPIEFSFDSPQYAWGDKYLPNRIAVIIGRNGSGKSTLLSRISRIAFSSTTDRRDRYLKRVGKISPPGLGFPRVILLSYSAFDSFNTPGIFKKDKELIIEEIKNGLGRYVFLGIRDIVTEIEKILPDLETTDEGKLMRKDILSDQTENTILKPIVELGNEFVKNIRLIAETQQLKYFRPALNLLAEEQSMHNLLERDFIDDTDKANARFFSNLSTGHKFVLHSLTGIIANVAPRSLLLFDEPETHLHPPILAALMKAIRYVLQEANAFMIVATHSPVILQETLRQHVYVLRREGTLLQATQPDIQTFGENIGILTQAAFGLSSDFTDFHGTLDGVIEAVREDLSSNATPEVILDKIESYFDIGLSMQARSYVLSKIYGGN